jgi:hypothetical protein
LRQALQKQQLLPKRRRKKLPLPLLLLRKMLLLELPMQPLEL